MTVTALRFIAPILFAGRTELYVTSEKGVAITYVADPLPRFLLVKGTQRRSVPVSNVADFDEASQEAQAGTHAVQSPPVTPGDVSAKGEAPSHVPEVLVKNVEAYAVPAERQTRSKRRG